MAHKGGRCGTDTPLPGRRSERSLTERFRSYTEPYLSTENKLVSHILLAVLSYFAEYEAKNTSRRTKGRARTRRAPGGGRWRGSWH